MLRIGQRVVCIAHESEWRWPPGDNINPNFLPRQNGVYTVSGLDISGYDGTPVLSVHETFYWYHRRFFRPLTDISIFQEILRRENLPKREDALV
jgi:hypothetical protein